MTGEVRRETTMNADDGTTPCAVVWQDRFSDKLELLEAGDQLGIGAPLDSGASYWMMEPAVVEEMVGCMLRWLATRRLTADDPG